MDEGGDRGLEIHCDSEMELVQRDSEMELVQPDSQTYLLNSFNDNEPQIVESQMVGTQNQKNIPTKAHNLKLSQ